MRLSWFAISIFFASATANGQSLKESLDAIVVKPGAQLRSASIGVSVFDLNQGTEIYSHNGGSRLRAASNAKILTLAAAFNLLGPSFRYQTRIYADQPDDDGVLKGNLYIRGRGDPILGAEHVYDLARQIARRGIKKVTGGIVVDNNYFDGVDLPPHYDEQPNERAGFRAPIGATSFNFNTLSVWVSPGRKEGARARVFLDPRSDFISVKNEVITRKRGRNRISIDFSAKGQGVLVTVTGQIRAKSSMKRWRFRVENPAQYMGGTFRKALREQGVRVTRKQIRLGVVPANATPLLSHTSSTLTEIATGAGKYSNNFMAEMLLKTIGAEANKGAPSTWQQSLSTVHAFLEQQIGFQPGSYKYENGSGLFSSSELTPRQLAKTLAFAAKRPRWAPEFKASLAVAGVDGTLAGRMNKTPAQGLVRAKTGTLNGVSALSGYADVGKKRVAFSILVNGFPSKATGRARALQDRIAVALVRYLQQGS